MSNEFLIITLAAPMASFGEIAGHERRGGRERPGKSALIGLLGAALGIRRDDTQAQNDLRHGFDIAVRVNNPGSPLQDYHTVQAVPTARIKKPETRRHALSALLPTDNPTTITRRDYRTDVHFAVAFARSESARWSYEELLSALREPRFTLYLGRKSCPFSLPLDPRIVIADDILQALELKANEISEDKRKFIEDALPKTKTGAYAALSKSAEIDLVGNRSSVRQERVHDEPLDRRRWHFGERREVIYPLNSTKEGQK